MTNKLFSKISMTIATYATGSRNAGSILGAQLPDNRAEDER
jgi:hypothetical protein